ncbi:caspase-7-like isoform X1 [Phycodurus eques]|uniref:caspase-7-like isoform X1 n=1 Tax=Phycodurus eques TaxID=693459 RepID=UPI002ACDA56A|nr:caspase-7-like isoform X1 [Phycodurus eques]
MCVCARAYQVNCKCSFPELCHGAAGSAHIWSPGCTGGVARVIFITERNLGKVIFKENMQEVAKRAVLVSVANFELGVPLGARHGAKEDTRRLHRVLSKLDFQVDIHQDLNSHEIYRLFRKESRRPASECFLAVLSSHGGDGCVLGADGAPVWLSRVFAYFDRADMERMAKVFLIQACRGDATDDGVAADTVDSCGERDEGGASHDVSVPVPVNSAVMYATVAGYVAFMHRKGSVFLQTFCSLLEDEDHTGMELMRLMTRLSHRVAFTFRAKGREFGGKKEMPCLLSRMTRDVFPFAKGPAPAPAVTFVARDVTKKRPASIG